MAVCTTWEYNGQSFELDLLDVATMEHYESVFDNAQKKSAEKKKFAKKSEEFRWTCELLYSIFDDLFGLGTSNALFGGKLNAGMAADAYESFLAFAHEQIDSANEKQREITTRYSANRADRR